MKGWVGLVGWPVANGLPTLMVTHQLQVERRTGKVRRSETDVLPLCYATNIHGRRHRCKKTFLRFFSVLVTYLRFLTCFYFPNVFRLKKTLAKFRAASRLTRSTFKITATKYRPMIFLLHVEWPEMPPYKLLLTYYVWRMFEWHIRVGYQAWSRTTVRRGNVFITFTNFFLFLSRFYVFNVF